MTLRATWIAPILAVLVAAAPARSQTPGAEAGRLYSEAYKLIQQKDYDKALENFKKILDMKDLGSSLKKGDLLYDVACLYSLKGQKAEALESLGQCVKEGYKDWKHMQQDSDLEAIRSDPKFQEILVAAGAPSKQEPTATFESVTLDDFKKYKTIDGADFDWASVKGKVVALFMGGSWHSKVQKATPFLLKFLEDHKAKNFAIVSVQFELVPIEEDNIGDAKKYRDDFKVTWPMLYAGDYDMIPTALPWLKPELQNKHPIIVLFDDKGKPRQLLSDMLDEAAFTRAVEGLLAEGGK